ncbi:MAG TPA: LuxR C-terminal-related transcriptional regulator [Symbiobacteriaceae bacterium]|nr:LuxR C-terminal-related transcriptional regulator [Symbiobacteriaceae bacterium]
MSSPLLHTKLYLPPLRPGLVPRPRLTRRLADGLQRPITLISAPAGFGKTTLLSEWRAAAEVPVAWLALDQHDNDPVRFWTYVVAALACLPDLSAVGAETLELLRTVQRAPAEEYLTPLINELGAVAAPVVLVLDDYHAIEAPPIHEAVSFLVEHLPPGLRLVVLTRSDPPWPLARLRANRQLAELRAADLRFTADEAAEFLNRVMGFDISPADVAALERRTEGWVAALQMVALSLEGHPQPEGFIAAFSGDNRYIADYLAEEVIARQPGPVQEFLLSTALMGRFTASLCEAVTGQADAQATLEGIERANLFLIPLDAERRWYRYHHLFADLLRAKLTQSQAHLIPDLHRRASRWYEENGFGIEAVEQALAAREYDRAADLIEANAHGWWALAASQFLQLMMKLPREVVERRPSFTTYLAWLKIVTGELDASAAFLTAAEQHLGAQPDPATVAFLSLMRTYIAELQGQPYVVTDEVRRASGYIPGTYVAMRNSADVVLSFILEMSGEAESAVDLLTAAVRRELTYNTYVTIPIAISRIARIRSVQGRLAEAEALLRQYLGIIEEKGARRYFMNGNLHAALGSVLLQQGRRAEAQALAEEALLQNERWGIANGLVLPLHVLARVRQAMGDLAGAQAALDRLEAIIRMGRTPVNDLAAELSATKIRLWLDGGDVAAAARWAEERGLRPDAPVSIRQEPELIAYARLLLAQGRQAEAGALLRRLEAAARDGGRPGRVAEIAALVSRPAAAGSPLIEHLSEREQEILKWMAEGLSNQQIADRLYLSVGTVKSHIHNLCGKLGARSRTHAVARARELHLL